MGLNVLGYKSHLQQRCHPACGHEGSSHLSPVLASSIFLSRRKFSVLTTRQPLVQFSATEAKIQILVFARVELTTSAQ